MPLIKIDEISKVYGHGAAATAALDKVSLSIDEGEFLAIMGPSGSGKSTLMNIIGMLDSPTSGKYLFESQDVSELRDKQLAKIRRRKIGFVFQSFNLLQRHTAVENVSLPMVYARMERFRRERVAAELLEKVGLEDRLYHFPNELSGGQLQRVAIARALANSPSIMLADEPTGNLDTKSGEKIMKLLSKLNADGHTIIMVTHDEKIAAYAKRVISLIDGRIDSDKEQNSELRIENSENKKEKEAGGDTEQQKAGNKKQKGEDDKEQNTGSSEQGAVSEEQQKAAAQGAETSEQGADNGGAAEETGTDKPDGDDGEKAQDSKPKKKSKSQKTKKKPKKSKSKGKKS